MERTDWLVTEAGKCEPRPTARPWSLIRDRYYFHHFLTDITNLVDQAFSEQEEWDFLPQIRTKVRQLLINSYWLTTQRPTAHPQTKVGVQVLYDEIGYPLTVQNVLAMPGSISPIHNHGTWGVVALLDGQAMHKFWRRTDPTQPFKIEAVGEKLFGPGEIISFMPASIHQVMPVGNTSTLTFQLYGDTQPQARYEYYPDTETAKPF